MKISVWDILSHKYSWITQDSDGDRCAFVDEPQYLNYFGIFIAADEGNAGVSWIPLEFTENVIMPIEPLAKRPEKKPTDVLDDLDDLLEAGDVVTDLSHLQPCYIKSI